MFKITVKYLLLITFFTVVAATRLFAQATITIGAIDVGPYAPGSTISIPFHINSSTGSINRTNTFSLYMSDIGGLTFPATPVATMTGFYGNYFNYTIPAGTTAGTYKFMVTASNPAITTAASNNILVSVPSASPTPSISAPTPQIITPGVFGRCNSTQTAAYTFTNTSTGATNVTLSVFDESGTTSVAVGTPHDITNTPFAFTAGAKNYRILVTATSAGGLVSTQAYQLINNNVTTNLGSTGTNVACIDPLTNEAIFTFAVDYTSATGIQSNYPGNTYPVTWGDGTTTNYTLGEIIAVSGLITHAYTTVSCGQVGSNASTNNRFRVDINALNPYCGTAPLSSPSTGYATIVVKPVNRIGIPALSTSANICTGSNMTFVNLSIPGPDATSTVVGCAENANALYTWLVDGVAIPTYSNVPRSTNFLYNNIPRGNHVITLRDVSGNGQCFADDLVFNLCVEDPPVANFTLPAGPICNTTTVTPTNTSVFDVAPCSASTYNWTVSPANYTFGGGTNLNSPQPQFNFTQAGIYTISLNITSVCGTSNTVTRQIIVDATPTAALEPDLTLCGTQTLTFNGTAGSATRVRFTGTSAASLALTPNDIYTWTVTGGSYSFVGGTNANSQYPQIQFNDFATYTITVNHKNTCDAVGATATQTITFQQAPTITASSPQTAICEGTTITLNSTLVSGPAPTGYQWRRRGGTGAIGAFSTGTAQNTTYAPTAADIAAGTVTLYLEATTGLIGTCSTVSSNDVTITITPTTVVTSAASKNICSNVNVNYNITSNNTGTTYTWTASVTAGSVSGSSANGTTTSITDVLVNNTPNVDGTVTYVITPTTNGCPGTPFNFAVTIPAIPVVTPAAANPAICSGNSTGITLATNQTGTMYTWTVSFPPGITGATDQSIPTASTIINNVLTNNTTGALRVTYTVTPYNIAGCAGTPVAVFVDVNPPTPAATVGPDQNLCNETQTTLTGNDPGASFTGQWTQVSGNPVTITTPNNFQTTVTGLVGGQNYTFAWTINGIAPCGPTSAQITITNNAPTVAGNTSGNVTVCAGENGQVTLTGHLGRILYWETSVNTGATWTRVNITTPSIAYTNITQTTQFRAHVQNGNCATLISPLSVVRVNQPPPQANAGPNQILCNQPSVNLVANNPGTFVGTWTQVSGLPVTITNPNNYQTTVTGLTGANTYVFRWTITALAPCVDTQADVTITNNPDVVASFTSTDKVGCGNLTVQFTNTSNNQTGANFIWNFGDGQTSSTASPQHTFAQRTDGKDTTYYISLAVIGNCVQRPAIVDSILVRPATPLARILPVSTAGCGNYAIDIRNTSPGNNTSYVFYLYDGNTLVQTITKTDKTNAVFDPITTTARKVFTVYMVATGYCNNTNETTHIPITISPSTVVAQMVIQGGINAGCAPLNTIFINNSFGGDNFYYNIYDANNNLVDRPVAGSTALPYRFTMPGTYYVTITAISNCGLAESPRTRVDVYATPTASFVADITSACKDALITFTNNTVSNDPNTPVTSLLYDWDFGDGSPHSALFAPTHGYHFTGTPYTVTLRVTNTTSGCTQVLVRAAYINLYGPPKTAFNIRPDSVTSIPNYTFSFIDQTPTDAVSWRWTFGDGQTSTRRNPTVTYPDTGVYRVTLTTATANGCDSTITRTVRIGGVPGQLFLPNAFMPESLTTELRSFMAKGSGIKTWHLQIFNNYGQLVWQTTKLSPKGEPEEGWDGTFRGVPAPQGVYQWQASATFINGTEWKGNSYRDELPKRVGSVHLIR